MKKVIDGVLICILMISMFFLGKNNSSMEGATPLTEVGIAGDTAEQNMRISAITDKNADFTIIPLEQGNFQEITYLDVNNVTINIDGTNMKLEDALLKGYVSVDEIIASARKDTHNGLCTEVAKSKNGLTEFRYHYQEFTLCYRYDLYETPDGKSHLITDFLICGIGSNPRFLPEIDAEDDEPIDYEDWGLYFEVSQVDPSSITINCAQVGGQQVGELNIGGILLFKQNPNTQELEQVQPLSEEDDFSIFTKLESWKPNPDKFLTMGGIKELSLNFAEMYGELSAGDYEISLQIVDWYNKEDIHPLLQNYYDAQWYAIEFNIE